MLHASIPRRRQPRSADRRRGSYPLPGPAPVVANSSTASTSASASIAAAVAAERRMGFGAASWVADHRRSCSSPWSASSSGRMDCFQPSTAADHLRRQWRTDCPLGCLAAGLAGSAACRSYQALDCCPGFHLREAGLSRRRCHRSLCFRLLGSPPSSQMRLAH